MNSQRHHLPQSPDWSIDWDALETLIPEIQALSTCPQNPIYHGEGDVLTHTKMVVSELVASTQWRNLKQPEQQIIFLATLLHDICKPECTKHEDDGRITSKFHAKRGASKVRWMLHHIVKAFQPKAEFTFIEREALVNLIRYHGSPLYLFEKRNPEREVISLSYKLRCDWLSMLVNADIRGRICADQGELLNRLSLFQEQCIETNCFTRPKAFSNEHTRFRYFNKERSLPSDQLFDDTEFEVILMSGLPGAGKDTWIQKNMANYPIISLDGLRESMGVKPSDNQGQLINAAKEKAKTYLRKKQPFVWNATNISKQIRSSLINVFSDYKARIKIVYVEAPLPIILEQNAQRTHPVPEKVILKLANNLEIPDLTEAHSVEYAVEEI